VSIEEALQAAISFARDRLLVAQMKIADGDPFGAASELRSAAETLGAALETYREDAAA
jgi:hypothetical protein